MLVMVVPSKSPATGLIGSIRPLPPELVRLLCTIQTLGFVRPAVPFGTPSVSRLVTCKVSDWPACNDRLLVTRLLAVIAMSPPATMSPLVKVVVTDCNMKELTPLETVPLLTKLVAQIIEPWSETRPLLTKLS